MYHWKLSETQLNQRINDIENDDLVPLPECLIDTGKHFSYIGWFWRDVSWDNGCIDGYYLYYPTSNDFDVPQFIGFMENNKWGYNSKRCTPEIFQKIREIWEIAVLDPTKDNLNNAFSVIQNSFFK